MITEQDTEQSTEPIIKPLKTPVSLKLKQYVCEECNKKFSINLVDKEKEFLHCPFCGAKGKNKWIFDIEIKGIGEY